MKILLIEDDQNTAAYLRGGLGEEGFAVDICSDGQQALDFAKTDQYRLLILDVMLPGRDGWSVLAEIRAAGLSVPVLMLTALGTTEQRIKGLMLGADDYLVKPFSFAELLARMRTILRRPQHLVPDRIEIDDLVLDLSRHIVERQGRRIELSVKEFALLRLLAERRGNVLSRISIAEEVWDMNFECDSNVVDVAIRRLRSKLDDGYDRRFIHTVRGRGYVLR
jgi:two-component system copper resistance phosphate regulon response regulator CusR